MTTNKLDQQSLEFIRKNLYVAAVCDILDELGLRNQAMHQRLRPLIPDIRNCGFIGRARTLWICAQRMDENGHQSHTAPVYITINKKPVRASENDAQFYVRWIDYILADIAPGGPWNRYYTHELDVVQGRYKKAKNIYQKIAEEANAQNN
jgi:hypothetical protein